MQENLEQWIGDDRRVLSNIFPCLSSRVWFMVPVMKHRAIFQELLEPEAQE